MENIVISAIALSAFAYLAFSRRLSTSSDWQATVTPLASIMGSGFLVSAPLLAGAVGNLALLFMVLLLVLAFLVGGVIRFNIQYFEPIENQGGGAAKEIAFLSRIVLSGAYFISVSYYLQLLAAFLLSTFSIQDHTLANVITTVLLLFIGVVGIWRGLDELEKLERYAVALNLGVIAALLAGLLIYNLTLLSNGVWALPNLDTHIEFDDLRVVLGLLIMVQGFETSRYLGDKHPPEQRIRTMRNAQLISAVIYLIFISLVTVLFHDGLGTDVTAIMEMAKPVALVMPLLISVAAIGSQFSASVADNAGAGGLIEEISQRRLSVRYAYLLVLCVTLVITWETDVNQIISYASRAFALFYTLQCACAFTVLWRRPELPGRSHRLPLFALLTVACLLVFLLGLPAE